MLRVCWHAFAKAKMKMPTNMPKKSAPRSILSDYCIKPADEGAEAEKDGRLSQVINRRRYQSSEEKGRTVEM